MQAQSPHSLVVRGHQETSGVEKSRLGRGQKAGRVDNRRETNAGMTRVIAELNPAETESKSRA